MAENALTLLLNINEVSKQLLSLLDTSNDELTSTSANSPQQVQENNSQKLISLMTTRDESIRLLFTSHSRSELAQYADHITTMMVLDEQLRNKVDSKHSGAKSKILQLKKNKKAINIYQQY